MASDLVPRLSGGLTRRRTEMAKARIDESAQLEQYRHDRLTEVVVAKLDNIDFATACRIQNNVSLGLTANHAIQQCPSDILARSVGEAMLDREIRLSRLFRTLDA